MKEENINGGQPPVNPQDNLVSNPATPVVPVQPEVPAQGFVPTQPVQSAPEVLTTEPVADIPVADPINSSNYSPANPLNGGDVSFVATGQSLEKKKSKKGLIILILFIIALLGVGIFFLVKLVILPMLITPKDVFSTSIETITKEINNTVNETIHDKSITIVEFDMDTNVEALKQFSGYTYSGKYGIDPKNKLLEVGFGIKDKYDKEYSYYSYVKDDKTYDRFSSNSSLLYTGALEPDSEIYDLFKQMERTGESLNPENINYVINKISTEFSNTIDENKLTEQKMSVTVNGEVIKAVKSTYSMDAASVEATEKQIVKALKNDKKAVKIIADLLNMTESDINKELQKIIDTKPVTNTDYTLNLSIYTDTSKTQFVGLEVEALVKENKAKIQYVTANGNFNVFIYSKQDANESSFTIDGVKTGNVTKVTLKEKEDLVKIKIEETSNGKTIDFELLDGPSGSPNNYTGTIVYSTKRNDGKISDTYNVTIKAGTEYIKVDATVTNDWEHDVANINTSAAVAVSDEELTVIKNTFNNDLINNTPWNSFLTLIGMFEDIEQVETDQTENWQ